MEEFLELKLVRSEVQCFALVAIVWLVPSLLVNDATFVNAGVDSYESRNMHRLVWALLLSRICCTSCLILDVGSHVR